jgi:hypothetical protein
MIHEQIGLVKHNTQIQNMKTLSLNKMPGKPEDNFHLLCLQMQ